MDFTKLKSLLKLTISSTIFNIFAKKVLAALPAFVLPLYLGSELHSSALSINWIIKTTTLLKYLIQSYNNIVFLE